MRSRWLAEAAPPVLGGLAEAGWLGVYAAAARGGASGLAAGLIPLVIASLTGVAAGRFLPFGRWRPIAIFLLAMLAMAAGVALARSAGSVPTTAAALLLDVLLGLALLRGVVHGRSNAADRPTEALVRVLPLLIGGGWLLGLAFSGEDRASFVNAAFAATLLCIVAVALALGSARLPDSTDARYGESTGRVWLMMLLMVVGSLVIIALPVAALIGLPVAQGVTSVLTSAALIVVAVVLGTIGAFVAVIAALLGGCWDRASRPPARCRSRRPHPLRPDRRRAPSPTHPLCSTWSDRSWAHCSWYRILGAAWYLAVRWQGSRDDTVPPDRVAERRAIALDVHIGAPAVGWLASRLRSARPPTGTLEAYPRLLLDWAAPHPHARRSAETPAAHAARLRSEGRGELGLDLLVADYELARFGGRDLSPSEERRAVARWRRLRRITLRSRAGW